MAPAESHDTLTKFNLIFSDRNGTQKDSEPSSLRILSPFLHMCVIKSIPQAFHTTCGALQLRCQLSPMPVQLCPSLASKTDQEAPATFPSMRTQSPLFEGLEQGGAPPVLWHFKGTGTYSMYMSGRAWKTLTPFRQSDHATCHAPHAKVTGTSMDPCILQPHV